MARQRGIIKLDGTLDDITFQKTQDGYRAKTTGRVSASKIATDPNFVRTRENMAEFSRAGKAARLFKTAFQSKARKVGDSRVGSRLVAAMMKVLQQDATNDRGLRNVLDGDLGLLKGFDFNVHATVESSIAAPFTASIDSLAGQAKINIPSFVPEDMVKVPVGATHFIVFATVAEVDFENARYTVQSKESAVLPWDNNATEDIDLAPTFASNSPLHLFLGLGIEFMQELHGKYYSLKNGAYNALSIVMVDK
jgi:hypothetical protein